TERHRRPVGSQAARGGFGTRSGVLSVRLPGRAGNVTRGGCLARCPHPRSALQAIRRTVRFRARHAARRAAGQMTRSANENAAPGAAFSVVPAIRSVADAVVVVDRRLLAREGVELADGP